MVESFDCKNELSTIAVVWERQRTSGEETGWEDRGRERTGVHPRETYGGKFLFFADC